MNYYYSTDGSEVSGPHSITELKRLHDTGDLLKTTQVCMEGQQSWQSLLDFFPETEIENLPLTPLPSSELTPQCRNVAGGSDRKESQREKDDKKGCIGCAGIAASLLIVCWITNAGGCGSSGYDAADRRFEEIKKDPVRLGKWINRVNELNEKKRR